MRDYSLTASGSWRQGNFYAGVCSVSGGMLSLTGVKRWTMTGSVSPQGNPAYQTDIVCSMSYDAAGDVINLGCFSLAREMRKTGVAKRLAPLLSWHALSRGDVAGKRFTCYTGDSSRMTIAFFASDTFEIQWDTGDVRNRLDPFKGGRVAQGTFIVAPGTLSFDSVTTYLLAFFGVRGLQSASQWDGAPCPAWMKGVPGYERLLLVMGGDSLDCFADLPPYQPLPPPIAVKFADLVSGDVAGTLYDALHGFVYWVFYPDSQYTKAFSFDYSGYADSVETGRFEVSGDGFGIRFSTVTRTAVDGNGDPVPGSEAPVPDYAAEIQWQYLGEYSTLLMDRTQFEKR
jgi:hypothetical protein